MLDHTPGLPTPREQATAWVARALSVSAGMTKRLVLLSLAVAACDGDPNPRYDGEDVDPSCTFTPEDCFGEVGGRCDVDDDCDDGICCRDKNCGPGTCTYLCSADGDCPPSMGCEHGFCFWLCDEDADCGPGQSCEHKETICEYEGGD
jgi:hypothetical protein